MRSGRSLRGGAYSNQYSEQSTHIKGKTGYYLGDVQVVMQWPEYVDSKNGFLTTIVCHGESVKYLPCTKRQAGVHYKRQRKQGGGGGIRTHGKASPTTVFETVPIGRSGTPP